MTTKTPPALVGSTFGKLTVIGAPVSGRDGNYLPCMCDCGMPVFVLWRILNAGSRTGCGNCRPKYKTERLYNIWGGMKDRCRNPNNPSYDRYGGRGILVCDGWMGYLEFRAWALANGYRDDLTLERKDVNGGYDPGNCTWIPLAQQSRNRRSCINISHAGETKILREWSEDSRCVVKYHTLYTRIVRDGWPFEAALTSPVGSRRPQASD